MNDDTISRQAAIDAVNKAFDRETLLTGFVRSIAVSAIGNTPSAQSERKKGKWVDKDGGLATCSECGDRWGVWSVMHYCPNCGAEMQMESQEEV